MAHDVKLFILPTCPYCRQVSAWLEELRAENPAYAKVEIEVVDERKNPDLANRYDYYLVPTFFLGEEKLHEGAATRDKVKAVLDRCLTV